MKNTTLLIGACILSILTGCHKSQSSQGASDIKNIALSSIASKYPSLDSSSLAFGSVATNTLPDGKHIVVVYYLPSSAKTNEYNSAEGKREKITTQMYSVMMSLSREIQSVHEGTREDIY
jgi:hypothetical protein